MSNMIKAYSVRYEEGMKMTIDTHLRIDNEIKIRNTKVLQEADTQSQFVEGLSAVVIDSIASDEKIEEKSEKILEDAKKEANSILEMAKKEAEKMKQDAYAQGQKKSYDDATHQVKKETQKLKAEYEEKARIIQTEHEEALQGLEPYMVDIIISLVEKITGIVIQDKDEVVLYLVQKALKNMDKSNEYTIRVSKDDFEYISAKKDLLINAIGREVSLSIMEDTSLNKNQCYIETDLKVLDCSLDIQLNNLIMDLKLISGI